MFFITVKSMFDDPSATEDTSRRGTAFPVLEDVFIPTEHAKETEMSEHSELLEYVNSTIATHIHTV